MLTADSLAPARVEPLLTGRFGRPYLYEDTVETTQSLLAPGDMPEGLSPSPTSRPAGGGRAGAGTRRPAPRCSSRSSSSRRVSATFENSLLVGGLATAEAVERATGLAAQIKWPNDVMLNRRKVAGVLAEASEGSVVLGIGLNVNQRAPRDLPQDARVAAGSLYTIDGVPRERAGVLADLVAALERNYEEWLQGGLNALYDGLGARDFLRGRKVEIDGRTGIGVGIDRQGRFELDLDGERTTIESGGFSSSARSSGRGRGRCSTPRRPLSGRRARPEHGVDGVHAGTTLRLDDAIAETNSDEGRLVQREPHRRATAPEASRTGSSRPAPG